MRNRRIFIVLFLLLIGIIVAGMIWLSTSPMMPTPHKMEQAVPDDKIPH